MSTISRITDLENRLTELEAELGPRLEGIETYAALAARRIEEKLVELTARVAALEPKK